MKIDANRLREFVKARGLTNKDVAAKAAISRQALQTMLSENGIIEVRDRSVKGLIHALGLAEISLLSPDPLAGYKKAVADENADLSFMGLGLPVAEPKSMDDIYVDVKVIQDCDRDHVDARNGSTEESEGTSIEESEMTVKQCLQLDHRVLIHGDPGCGKTTALRHAARTYASESLANSPVLAGRLPLMVPLAHFAKMRDSDREMSLIRFVVTNTLRGAASEYSVNMERRIVGELKNGSCLVLLDGLDEVGRDTGLFPVLSSFVNQYCENQFVLSSRTVGLDKEPWRKLGFNTFQVTRWSEADIGEFTRKWYAARPLIGAKSKRELERRAHELTSSIMSQPALRAIASNPLMLTILAALHYDNASLPRRRVDLYGKIVDVMLESWEAKKRDARPGDPLHGIMLDSREFGWLLSRLALEMQRKGQLLCPRWRVNDCIQEFLREQMALDGAVVKEQSDRVIRYICERTGLLVERGGNMFGFGHRSFQEYFAARGLLLEADDGADIVALLRQFLFHPLWEEVVIYVAASLSAPKATTLLRIVLDDPDTAGRFLRRGQRLALRCLIDGTAVAERAILNQIFSEGDVIGASRWLGISIEFTKLLKQLFATRHNDEANQMRAQIEVAARKKLPMPVYRDFYLLSHDPPGPPQDDSPGAICRKLLGGRSVKMVWPALRKRLENPKAWFKEALRRVHDSTNEFASRRMLIWMLGDEADSNVKAKNVLIRLLEADPLPKIRAEAAAVLGRTIDSSSDVVRLLREKLDNDESSVVCASCAMALKSVAPENDDVRLHLESIFKSGSDEVRAGAADGLSRVNLVLPEHKELLNRMLTTIQSAAAPKLRSACVWAMASFLKRDDIVGVVEKCLNDSDSEARWTALHVLSDAITEGDIEWSDTLAAKLETSLMDITDPCPHLYHDLVALVAMKEVRGKNRLDRVLGESLVPFGDRIKMAFVFGSVARSKQVGKSDIDLMVIGEARLKEIAAALHAAEQILGRPINPVLFSADKFREEYRQGNQLLVDVVRKEKIFLKGNRDELTELVADRPPD